MVVLNGNSIAKYMSLIRKIKGAYLANQISELVKYSTYDKAISSHADTAAATCVSG